MAKKKEVLTIEEKLEKALVPDWEQPYKVPSNWIWTRLGSLGNFGMGQTILSKNLSDIGIPVYSATEEDKIFGYVANSENKINLTFNDLVIPARGNSIGYVKYISDETATCTQTTMYMKPFSKDISKLLYFYMKCYKDILFQHSGNAIPQITITNIKEKMVVLPPLAEQKRIVERIESLFSKLDEAKELAQSALDSFENRKSAILHKAFTGELTKMWREENGVGIESWEEYSFDDLIHLMQNGLSKRNGKGIPTVVLRLADIGINSIVTDDLRIINLTSKEQDKYCLNDNDILMIRVNGSKENVGRQILIIEPDNFAFCDHLIRINYNNKLLNNKIMIYYSYTSSYRNYIKENMVSSAGQNTISRKGLSNLKLKLPTLPEQKEIVRILDSIFEEETKAKECANVTLQIDLMKKAILARAFRGELGTNDDSDESAVELLREIISQQENEHAKPKKRNEKKVLVDGNIISQLATDFEETLYKYIAENQPISMISILDSVSSSKQLDALDTISTLCKKGFVINKGETYSIK